jgi:hypothetical protein
MMEKRPQVTMFELICVEPAYYQAYGIDVEHLVQSPGRFLNIIGQNPSAFKSDRLHVCVIFWFFFIRVRYIP